MLIILLLVLMLVPILIRQLLLILPLLLLLMMIMTSRWLTSSTVDQIQSLKYPSLPSTSTSTTTVGSLLDWLALSSHLLSILYLQIPSPSLSLSLSHWVSSSIYLPTYLLTYLPVYLSIHQYIHPYLCLSPPLPFNSIQSLLVCHNCIFLCTRTIPLTSLTHQPFQSSW